MNAAQSVAAVVLGAAVWPEGQPSPTLLRRTQHAVFLISSGRVNRIVASGGLGLNPPSEASVMKGICVDANINPALVILEERATNTLENIKYSYALVPDAKLVIVTDTYHAPRAWLTARALNIPASVSCPAMQGTAPLRVLKSWLRECIALPFYAIKLAALRITSRL